MLCLLITVLILTKVRKHFRSDRIVIQISLSVSLLLLHILTLLHEIAIMNEITCVGLAILTHYFLLTTGKLLIFYIDIHSNRLPGAGNTYIYIHDCCELYITNNPEL